MVKFLFKHGACPKMINNKKKSPVDYAVEKENTILLKLLYKKRNRMIISTEHKDVLC